MEHTRNYFLTGGGVISDIEIEEFLTCAKPGPGENHHPTEKQANMAFEDEPFEENLFPENTDVSKCDICKEYHTLDNLDLIHVGEKSFVLCPRCKKEFEDVLESI